MPCIQTPSKVAEFCSDDYAGLTCSSTIISVGPQIDHVLMAGEQSLTKPLCRREAEWETYPQRLFLTSWLAISKLHERLVGTLKVI